MEQSNKRAYGQGSVVYNAERKRYQLWYADATGKRKAVTLKDEQGKPVTTKADAEKSANKLMADVNADRAISTRSEAVEALMKARGMLNAELIPVEKLWIKHLGGMRARNTSAKQLEVRHAVVQSFQHFCLTEGLKTLGEVTPQVADYFLTRKYSHLTGSTYNAYRAQLVLTLVDVLSIADPTQDWQAKYKPVKTRDLSDSEAREALTAQQASTLLQAIDAEADEYTTSHGDRNHLPHAQQWKVLIATCLYAGLDGKTATHLMWEDVRRNCLYYKRSKTGKAVTAPLHPDLKALLEKHEEATNSIYLFPDLLRQYVDNPRAFQVQAQQLICETLGLEAQEHRRGRAQAVCKYSLHSLRHTFVSLCAEAGAPLETVASILGHSSSSVTRHYTHVSPQAQAKAVRAISLTEPDERAKNLKRLAQLAESMTPEQLSALLETAERLAQE